MTTAEVKVKELSEKLLDIIACNRNANASPETTLKNIEAYLGGICDGTDRRNSREWYMGRGQSTGDPHGQAPLMWLAQELIKIKKK